VQLEEILNAPAAPAGTDHPRPKAEPVADHDVTVDAAVALGAAAARPDQASREFPAGVTNRVAALVAAGTELPQIVEELRHDMQVLRQQLDAAFDEVVGQLSQVDRRLGAVLHDSKAHGQAIKAADARSAQLVELVRHVGTTLEDALTSAEIDPDQAASESSAGLDLGAVDARLDQLGQGLATQLIDSRLRIEASLDQLRDQLAAVRDRPVTVDTKPLEDAAQRGSLHNSADIANLRGNIEALAETVRAQDRSIGDLRTTIDWIKERLLLR
jgi:hypothetical protein